MEPTNPTNKNRAIEITRECVRRALRTATELPRDDEDLLASGTLDSMGWVEVLECAARAAGIAQLADPRDTGQAGSIASLAKALEHAESAVILRGESGQPELSSRGLVWAEIAGWGWACGSQRVPAAVVEKEYALPAGKLSEGAGIESLSRASTDEDELVLAQRAAANILRPSGLNATELDWVLATSETQVGYPSLAALLHSRLLLRETCGALDVGGACLGLVNALVVAQSLIATGQAKTILVVTADVHSRLLAPGRVPGEFGGLFGDGASAFVLRSEASEGAGAHRLGAFHFGCAGHFAAAIRVGTKPDGRIDLYFDGEALSRAAVSRLEQVLTEVELRSGIPRREVAAFATHQPNPRLVELLARQLGVPAEKFPAVARTSGNLGSSTCGLALARALGEQMKLPADKRQPIFLASLGPGLLWGGGWLAPVRR